MKDTDIAHLKDWLGTGSINIFGRPFAGKDTQGRKLAELFDAALMGGGDILRNSEMPEKLKAELKTGKLFPTDDYIKIVLPYLSQPAFEGKPLILSSVGRWSGEEQGVIEATEKAGHPIKAVIYLHTEDEATRERWRALGHYNDRGFRHDDTEEVLDIRLDEFRDKTLPVLETYRTLGLLIEIDGHGTADEVLQKILFSLLTLSKPASTS